MEPAAPTPPRSPAIRVPPRLGRARGARLAIFGLSLLFFNLGGVRVLTYHETLFATPAKEMLKTGDWLVPRIAGQASTHKPPGTEWAQATAMRLFDSDAEWVVRLPSALAACLQALVLAALAARWFGERIGFVAGLIQLSTLYVLQLARLGEADMLLCLAVTMAMSSFAVANVGGPVAPSNWRGWPIVFYGAVAASYFFKGLMGPMVVFSGAAAYVALAREWRPVRFLCNPWGLMLFAGCTLGWFAAAVAQYPPLWEDQVAHHFGRFRGDLGGAKAPYFYVWAIPLVLLPWTPLVVIALARGLRSGQYAQPFWKFAACWALPGLVVLSLATFKSKHYPAPLLAPASILAAFGLREHVGRRLRGGRPGPAASAALVVAASGVAIAAVMWTQPRASGAISCLIAVVAAGFLTAIACEIRHSRAGYVRALFATIWLAGVGVQGWVMPAFDSYRDQTHLARRAAERIPIETTVYLVGLPENQVVYYLDRPMVRHDDPATFLAQPPPGREHFVLAPNYIGETLSALGLVEMLDRSASINRYMTERDRLTLFRLVRGAPTTAATPQPILRTMKSR